MRKAQAKKLPLAPDPKFNDKLVTRFVNNLMWEGKKSGAYTIFYDALDKVTKQTSEDGYEVWKRALANVTPGVEVRSRRIGGATFQIPAEVRQDRKVSLSIKWLIRYSRDRNGRSMSDKLAGEIVAASKGEKIHTVWLKQTKLLHTSESNGVYINLKTTISIFGMVVFFCKAFIIIPFHSICNTSHLHHECLFHNPCKP